MKYYLIVGEASGDLHASLLMRSLLQEDPEAEFRFFGGDHMAAVGGTLVSHYKGLAYMGFVPVLLHLPAIFRSMALCRRDIMQWQPDALILVDYAGFNLKIAKWVHRHRTAKPRIFYYIPPKLWAWKEWRMRNIRRDIDQLYSILPFEKAFYEQKHHFPMHYVGNPTADEVRDFLKSPSPADSLSTCDKPIIALLAGSRRQEIKDNLPAMIEAAVPFAADYQLVVAGAPAIDDDFYAPFLAGKPVLLVKNQTYPLLARAHAALVTSGTATLETALFRVPQVVCYKTPVPRLVRFAFNHIIKCRYISLVNLVADREVVPELLADRFSVASIRRELEQLLGDTAARQAMLRGYSDVEQQLTPTAAADRQLPIASAGATAARLMRAHLLS